MQDKNEIDERKIRGIGIVTKGDTPKKIKRNTFLIPSQSESNRKYAVTIHGSKFSCTCKDHVNTNKNCKHIHALAFWLELRKQLKAEITNKEPMPCCIYCNSKRFKKNGIIKSNGKQRYFCNDCKQSFIAEKDFKKFKGNGQIITACLDLYFKGISLRKIKDHLKQFYNLEIDHSTIYRWIQRFIKIINNYTDTIKPETSDIWHADEQAIKSKGRFAWSWNLMDGKTRFLIANIITEGREVKDARKLFRKAKEIASNNPDGIITDGLQSYRKSIKKEFHTKRTGIEHIRLETIRAKINNNRIERYHNSFRERDKTMRGFQNNKTAQIWANGFRAYYNFIRPHTTLGMTPARASGIDLQLGQNKWLGLIKQSSGIRAFQPNFA